MAFAESGGQPTALGAVVERTRAVGVVLDADIDPDVAHLDSMRRLAVLRVVQEGLTNVVRHAGRHPRAALTVVADRDGVRIAVTDDGPGAPAGRPGFGLVGMRERVELLGGRVAAGRHGGERVRGGPARHPAGAGRGADGPADARRRRHHRHRADHRVAPGVRVLVLTTFDDDEHLYPALSAGAQGFLGKDAPPEDLLDAVRRTAAGESPFSREVLHRLVAAAVAAHRQPPAADAVEALTLRERDVLALVGEGLSNAEVAARLHVAVTTVKTHVTSLMAKTVPATGSAWPSSPTGHRSPRVSSNP